MKNSTTTTVNIDWIKDLPSSIALLNHDFCLVNASNHWIKNFELQNREVYGKTLFDVFPRLSEDFRTKLEYAMDGLKDIQVVDKMSYDNGEAKDFIWHFNPWIDGYGKSMGIVINVKDVTRNKELQLELNRTKNLLKEKGKIAKIGSWEYDREKDEVLLSPIVKEIFEYEGDSKINLEKAIGFYKEGKSRIRIINLIQQALENGKPWDENLQLVNKKNEVFWVNTIGRPKFKDGKCSRIIGTIQDVTEKLQTKDWIKDPADKGTLQDATFDLAPVGMAITDFTSGRILKINDALAKLTGYSKDELEGKLYQGFGIFKVSGRKSSVIQQLTQKGAYDVFDIDFKTKESKQIKLRLKGKLITGTNGTKKVLSVIDDVSIAKSRTENLRKQAIEANETIEKLVNFSHMVSHNLKGHTTNFSLLLNFLEKETEQKERKELISLLRNSTDNLTATTKGLREIVSIRNNYKLKKEALNLNEFIYRAEQGLTGLIKKGHAKIINEIPEKLKIKAIPVYLDSILGNCLSNAIRFRKEDKTPVVILSAKIEGKYTVLSIEDNGTGIDLEENKDKLFALGKTLSDINKTRGMGLYLAKYQIELMKGKIEVESTLGEGTIFKIFFPNK